MCDSFLPYEVHARVTPAKRNGYGVAGRQIPSFNTSASSAEAAAEMVVRTLRAAVPDAEFIEATTYRVTGDGVVEWGFSHHSSLSDQR